MVKCLNPKDQGWASPEARKRWWSIVTELEREGRALAKDSLVLDVDIAAAKAKRDRRRWTSSRSKPRGGR